MYRVKELFYSLQGEGARAGRPAVFCRFSKCNLWNGREADRASAQCTFCDTDFVGTDGQNGGEFATANALAAAIAQLWPDLKQGLPYVVCTGGEPLLQLDVPLLDALHQTGFEVAVETNGTLPAPEGIDWVCLSPKAHTTLALSQCHELKLVFPQTGLEPRHLEHIQAHYYYLSPMADPSIRQGHDPLKDMNTQRALDYCLAHPQWRLSLQTHKLLGID